MKRLLTVVYGLTVLLGLLLALGPGETLHHQLHKWDIKPYFRECCCADPRHTRCAWGDHFGGPWRRHHPGISLFGFTVLGLTVVVGLTACVCRCLCKGLIPPGHCQDCGYDLTGNVSGRCPECGKAIGG